jgi:hypothetical protein
VCIERMGGQKVKREGNGESIQLVWSAFGEGSRQVAGDGVDV